MTADHPPPGSGASRDIDPTIRDNASVSAGRHIGPYRLLERIGEGGMGEVWRAEQTSPVRRTVALKLIKAGMDSREVIARFEAERQALALMDHPYIARVFDAGATEQAHPYFAMEYVKGVSITEYCDRHRLSARERLELFQLVCAAVQHAHQKAVLHRDLKPNNVLVADVDGKPCPKIIDFGVAKATTQKLTEKTMFTAMGQLIGTPEYMSPEQAELTGEDVDTRTDVYSLGVILYELLAGALPFDSKELRKAGFEGIRKIIRDQDPPRPSTRLSTLGEHTTQIATNRRTGPKRLANLLKGELDWIVMRTLEKDRNRRYGSPQELAQDIERHLNDEPVLAGPPSSVYRAGKFIRRNRLGVSLATATLVVIVAFSATMAVQSQRIASERDRANREAEASERVSSFLADMLGDVDPQRLGSAVVELLEQQITAEMEQQGSGEQRTGDTVAAFRKSVAGINRPDLARALLDREILSQTAATIEDQLGQDPAVAARLHQTVASSYNSIGLYEQAEEHALRALTIREAEFGEADLVTLSSRQQLAGIYQSTERYEENAETSQNTINALMRSVGMEHPQTVRSIASLAAAYHDLGRIAESDSLYQIALQLQTHLKGPEDPRTLRYMRLAGDLAAHQDRMAEAESLYTRALVLDREILGEDHPETNGLRSFYSYLLRNREDYDAAESLLLEVVESDVRTRGEHHPSTLWHKWELGRFYTDIERYEDAEPILLETLAACLRVLSPTHMTSLNCYRTLADVYNRSGQAQDERAFFEEMVVALGAAARRKSTAQSMRIGHAWNLLERVPPEFVDPELPLQIALEAGTGGSPLSGRQMRTLASAYCRAGDLAMAVQTQGEAIALMGDEETKVAMEEQLAVYNSTLAEQQR